MAKGPQIRGLLFSAALTLLGWAAVVIVAERNGIDLVRLLWRTRVEWFGAPEIGIWREHPVLGWAHVPNVHGRHFMWFAYDVTYHIDENGNRVTAGSPSLPKILFLGCSLTFGHGVADGEAYPSLLQGRLPDYKVVNAAVMGWGTAQAFLKLREQLERYAGVRLVVYGFIEQHIQRNSLRPSWLRIYGRNPVFTLSGDHLVFRGLVGPSDGVPASSALDEQEREITRRLIAEMVRLCRARGVLFVVLHLPNPGILPTGERGERSRVDFGPTIRSIVGADRYLDLRPAVDYGAAKLRHDFHYRPEGHEEIALAIWPQLERWLAGS